MNLENLVKEIVSYQDNEIVPDLIKDLKKKFAKESKLSNVPTNMQVLATYNKMVDEWKITPKSNVRKSLRKRWIRSKSWIVPVQVLTKPWPCPWKCIFCPDDATMPKSYINTEPWAMRALLNQFDPIKQTYNRLMSLFMTGHDIDKIEMIVLGWTWDSYPKEYKRWFVKSLYDACNTFFEFKSKNKLDWNDLKFSKFTVTDNFEQNFDKTLEESQKNNEKADCRIIWLTIETRPEFVTDENCKFWRELGVTRLEIWIQSLYDDVLEKNDRWNTVQQARNSLHKLRQYWFKFSCHFMPGLYWSSVEKDIKTMEKAYSDVFMKPDEIKFYPTSVIPNTRLYELRKEWYYEPLTNEQIKHITKKVQVDTIPPYTRIKRLIRDIPETEIVAGSKLTNLRQIVMNNMHKEYKEDSSLRENHYKRLYPNSCYLDNFENIFEFENWNNTEKTYIVWWKPNLNNPRNFVSLDTRAREISNRTEDAQNELLIIRKYFSSVGEEFFISFEDEFGYLYGFLRLLLPYEKNTINRDWLWENVAMVRELHVYWQLAKINKNIEDTFQHKWFWSRMMEISERISLWKNYKKISVISWVGVRDYYRKLWYHLEWTYMVKDL